MHVRYMPVIGGKERSTDSEAIGIKMAVITRVCFRETNETVMGESGISVMDVIKAHG